MKAPHFNEVQLHVIGQLIKKSPQTLNDLLGTMEAEKKDHSFYVYFANSCLELEQRNITKSYKSGVKFLELTKPMEKPLTELLIIFRQLEQAAITKKIKDGKSLASASTNAINKKKSESQ